MRKIMLALAGLATLGIALPYAAPAKAEKTVIIKHRSHDRMWHPHHRTVIIKHERHEHHD